jgi:hypothetical protein
MAAKAEQRGQGRSSRSLCAREGRYRSVPLLDCIGLNLELLETRDTESQPSIRGIPICKKNPLRAAKAAKSNTSPSPITAPIKGLRILHG